MSGFDRPALTAQLTQGLEALALPLTDTKITQVIDYLALLCKWNAVYNLTAVRDPKEMVKLHLLDSLAAVYAFKDAQNILDVGAGGGLPGMMLGIVYPEARVSMIDIVHKKTAFLTQAKTELCLRNVTVHTGRVEALKAPQLFDVVTSRAFAELNNFVSWSGHLLAEGGQFIAMKGILPTDEIADLPAGWQVEKIEPLTVPSLDAERHLIHIKKLLS
jgi:16S rRNA (guanine527-N7)-methyltransferase